MVPWTTRSVSRRTSTRAGGRPDGGVRTRPVAPRATASRIVSSCACTAPFIARTTRATTAKDLIVTFLQKPARRRDSKARLKPARSRSPESPSSARTYFDGTFTELARQMLRAHKFLPFADTHVDVRQKISQDDASLTAEAIERRR